MSAQGGENALITGAAPGGGKPRFVAAAKGGIGGGFDKSYECFASQSNF